MKDEPLTRREFFTLFSKIWIIPVGAGVLGAEIVDKTATQISTLARDITSRPIGNAAFVNETPEEKVIHDRIYNPFFVGVNSFAEELFFRLMPALILRTLEKKDDPDIEVTDSLLHGNAEKTLTRREFLWGIYSSLVFGLVHNVTSNGIDTKTIPLPQFYAGLVFWYLQRKFGILSNSAAHIWQNFRAFKFF